MSGTIPTPHGPIGSSPPGETQFRGDRWAAVDVVALLMTMMALAIWLAGLGGGTPPEGLDYWPMLP